MDRTQKSQWRDELVDALDKAQAVYVTQFKGMTVEDLTDLRRELRKSEAHYRVVKNSIARKAIEGRGEAVMADFFKGQIGVIFADGDVAAAAKTLKDIAKKNNKLVLVGGYMEGNVIDAKGVEAIASLPSREVLLAKIIGSLVAPHRGLLGVLQGVPRAMVSVLNQIKEKKGEAAG
jgi:large subunit ribosomal protein L10